MKRIVIALVFVLFGGSAFASCPNVPYSFTNGTTADANQVMSNFNALLSCINAGSTVLRGYLGGLALANDTGSPSTVIDVAAGMASSDDAATLMITAGATKNANAPWAVGTSNGCLDTGSSLAASTWYHVFIIERTDTGVVDVLCSMSATTPAPPANYSEKRRIGSFKTDASAHIVKFTQNGDQFLWSSYTADFQGTPIGTTPVTLTLNVPTGVKVNALFNLLLATSGGQGPNYVSIYSPDSSATPGAGTAGLSHYYTQYEQPAGQYNVRTNTAGQVMVAQNLNDGSALYGGAYGWIDRRGQDN